MGAAIYLLLKWTVRILDRMRICSSHIAAKAVMYCGFYEIADTESRFHKPVKATVIGYSESNNAVTLQLTHDGGILDGVIIDVDVNVNSFIEADMLSQVPVSIKKYPSLVQNTLKRDGQKLASSGVSSPLIEMTSIVIKMTVLPSLAAALKERE